MHDTRDRMMVIGGEHPHSYRDDRHTGFANGEESARRV